jgi:hypothetical protein
MQQLHVGRELKKNTDAGFMEMMIYCLELLLPPRRQRLCLHLWQRHPLQPLPLFLAAF